MDDQLPYAGEVLLTYLEECPTSLAARQHARREMPLVPNKGEKMITKDFIEEIKAKIPGHPSIRECNLEGGECSICAVRDCPYEDPFHYHHDGCPSCESAFENQ